MQSSTRFAWTAARRLSIGRPDATAQAVASMSGYLRLTLGACGKRADNTHSTSSKYDNTCLLRIAALAYTMKQRSPPEAQAPHPVATGSEQPAAAAQADAARLKAAFAMHQQGQLNQAEAIYEEILQSWPQHFDALQLLAIIAAQRKNSAAAVELFDQALKVNPNHAGSLNNRGNALRDLKRCEEALES